MNWKRVVVALRREKALLERVLELAEWQFELIQSGRLEDVEVLLSLRAEPMSELALSELNVGQDMPQLENDPTLTTHELEELRHLNLQIIRLTNRIIDIDDMAEQLAELSDMYLSTDNPAQTEA